MVYLGHSFIFLGCSSVLEMLVVKRFYRKMIKVRGNRPIVIKQGEKNNELEENAKLGNLDWRIVGAT